MANTIKLKRGSGSDPSASDLAVGELAIRTDSGKIFTKKDNGSVAEISGGGGISDGDKGDITVSNGGDTFTIDAGAVTAAKIQNDLPVNKLSVNSGHIIVGDANGDGSLQALNGDATINNSAVITIANGAINNAKVASDAAIAGTKISPNFGSQNIITTGTFASGNQVITANAPSILFSDSNNNPDYQLKVDLGAFVIRDNTAQANRLTVDSSGIDVTGGITATGSIGCTSGSFSDTIFAFGGIILGQNDIIKFDTDNTNINHISFKGPNSLSSTVTYTLPEDGSANEVLKTDGSGVLSFGTIGTASIADDAVTNAKIADDAVDSDQIANGSIDHVHLGVDIIGQENIADGAVRTEHIQDGAIVNADINASAAIDLSKLNSGTLPNGIAVTQSNIAAGQLVTGHIAAGTAFQISNNNVASDAAIAGSKIDPDFGSQNVVTTGTLGSGNITITGSQPGVSFIDDGQNPDYLLYNNNGVLRLHDSTNNADRFIVNTDGHVDITGNLDVGAGLDVTGNLDISSGNLQIGGTNVLNSGRALYNLESLKLADSKIAKFGSSDDLQIYHSSDISRIRNTNDSGTLKIQATSNGENAINIVPNGTVELFYDGNKKLETTNLGTKIIGDLWLDNPDNAGEDIQFDSSASKLKFDDGVSANFGSGDDCTLEHSGADFAITNSTGNLNILCNSNQAINLRHGTENMLRAITDGAVELYHDGTRKLHTRSDAINIIGDLDMTDADNYKINLGAGSDLQLYHDGSNSYIKNAVGDLIFQHGSENLMQLKDDGAVQLYFDNAQKLETYSHGIRANQNIHIQGSAYLDDADVSNSTGILHFGDSQDLQIYHDGTDSYIASLVTGALIQRARTSWLLGTNATSGGSDNAIHALQNGAVELYYDNSKKLETTSNGADVTGQVNINGGAGNGTNDATLHVTATSNSDWGIIVDKNNSSATEYGVDIRVGSSASYGLRVVGGGSEAFRVQGNGNVTLSGTLDGRDIASDGSKLDGIAAGATNVTNNNQLTNGAGYITASSIPTVTGAAKKFVNFDGTNNSIRNDLGVSSISDHGAGQYTVNFDGNFANTNYTITHGIYRGSGKVLYHFDIDNTITTSSHRIMISAANNVGNVGLVARDTDQVHMAFHLN